MPRTLFPACFVEFPASASARSASFYLAAEEYVAQTFVFGRAAAAADVDTAEVPAGADESAPLAYLFTWQLPPTVVMGRNQVAHQEVDLDFCEREGIDVVRRKSGGGAIFADERNIMTSLVTAGGAVEPLFQAYAAAVSGALNAMGATTVVSGRNDILLITTDEVGETSRGKICGNAFYHLADRNIVHGTMLYDTNPRLMQGALHPDQSKLQAAGVKSVRSRVALLKDVLPFDVGELRQQLRQRLTASSIQLSEADVLQIEAIERGYRDEQFLYGRRAGLTTVLRRRIDGVGTLELHLSLRNGRVEQLALSGDFFEHGEAAEPLFRTAFEGHPLTPAAVRERIAAVHPEKAVRHLTAEALEALMSGE